MLTARAAATDQYQHLRSDAVITRPTTTRATASDSRFAGLRAASARARGEAPAEPKPAAATSAVSDRYVRDVVAWHQAQASTGAAAPQQPAEQRQAAADAVWTRAHAAAAADRRARR